MDLCNQTLALQNNGVKVSIIVSAMIVSYTDWKLAQQCYGLLNENGVSIRKALTKFSFAHQKYWIIDNKEVHLSTGQEGGQEKERKREKERGGWERREGEKKGERKREGERVAVLIVDRSHVARLP
ncbi:MAG: phospholipase D family protein [Proteobacteria bacterium]|nr:phospholipase D family protein [Pseudomonadota bacterium]